MFSLKQALHDHELIVLRVIGEWWELDLTGTEKLACVNILAETLGAVDMQLEIKYLGPEESAALEDLINSGGRTPVASFERVHGTVRHMGPGRLEREEPWLDPISPAEALWYRGFLFRAFDESEMSDLVEYYYLPDELFGQFPKQSLETDKPIDQKSTQLTQVTQPEEYIPEITDAVDDITTIIAYAQNLPVQEEDLKSIQPLLLNRNLKRASLLFVLASELHLLRATDEGAKPSRKIVTWLQKKREESLRDVANAWSRSAWNELWATPGIICEGSGWQNDPISARTTLLDSLPREEGWYRISELINFIKEEEPDFQRPDGNYDTWYIRDLDSGDYLAGFDNWHMVEGRLLRFLIQGPMVWLGLVETNILHEEDDFLFRLTPRALDWFGDRPVVAEEVAIPIVINGNATISVPFNANRYHRFQVARLSEAEAAKSGFPFQYQLTPKSLKRAKEQGIEPDRMHNFLEKASGRPLPPSVKRAIQRWSELGTEARLEKVILLRVRDPEILEKLRSNPKTRDYISESMGDLAVVVRPGDWQKLIEATAELGLLIDHDSSDWIMTVA
jgi:hypothetical protein